MRADGEIESLVITWAVVAAITMPHLISTLSIFFLVDRGL
jgi:hypothetical protein